MQTINVNSLLTDPLAGCNSILKSKGNYNTFIATLKTMMLLFVSRQEMAEIWSYIALEDHAPLPGNEYLINELLYEYRLVQKQFSKDYEKVVLDAWTKKIIKKYGTDAALDFIFLLNKNRQRRPVL